MDFDDFIRVNIRARELAEDESLNFERGVEAVLALLKEVYQNSPRFNLYLQLFEKQGEIEKLKAKVAGHQAQYTNIQKELKAKYKKKAIRRETVYRKKMDMFRLVIGTVLFTMPGLTEDERKERIVGILNEPTIPIMVDLPSSMYAVTSDMPSSSFPLV